MDDLLSAGTHQIIKGILTELSRDLELKSSEVTTKPTRYLGRTQSSTCPRSHCDGNVRQMRRRYACTGTESLPTCWKMWIDRADLRCSMGKTSSSLGRRSDTDKRNIKSILRHLRGNNHDSAADDTQSGSGEKSSCGLSVDALRLRQGWRRRPIQREWNCVAFARQTWLVPDHRVEQISQRSHSAMAKPSWSLHSLEPVNA